MFLGSAAKGVCVQANNLFFGGLLTMNVKFSVTFCLFLKSCDVINSVVVCMHCEKQQPLQYGACEGPGTTIQRPRWSFWRLWRMSCNYPRFVSTILLKYIRPDGLVSADWAPSLAVHIEVPARLLWYLEKTLSGRLQTQYVPKHPGVLWKGKFQLERGSLGCHRVGITVPLRMKTNRS